MGNDENRLQSLCATLFTLWQDRFGAFSGPHLLIGAVQSAIEPLKVKYRTKFAEFLNSLSGTRNIELVISGADGFLVDEQHLRRFFEGFRGVQWCLSIRSTRTKTWLRVDTVALFSYWEHRTLDSPPDIVQLSEFLSQATDRRKGLSQFYTQHAMLKGKGRNTLVLPDQVYSILLYSLDHIISANINIPRPLSLRRVLFSSNAQRAPESLPSLMSLIVTGHLFMGR